MHPAMWAYPWTLLEEGPAATCEDLAARGVDALNVASHYHSVRSLEPRRSGGSGGDDEETGMFRQFAGGCYFDPDPATFEGTPIDPLPNRIDGVDDALARIAEAAGAHGLRVNAWTVCLHNTRLAAANPEYRVESAFGDPQDHAFCPSHPDVREYFAGVVASVADRADEVQLESIGYPTAFHGHGESFGHDKRQVLTTPTERILASQCFCDGCRAAARDHRVDLDAARRRVRELLADSLSGPHGGPSPLGALVQEDATLGALFDFRAAVIDRFVARTSEAAADTPLNYYDYMSSAATAFGSEWPLGVRRTDLAEHLDRITTLCYVTDPAIARRRLRRIRRAVDLPVDAGVTLDPDVLAREDQFRALVDAIADEIDGRLSIYHHSLASETHLGWIERAFAGDA